MLNECDQLAADFENPEYTQAPGNQNITKRIDRVYAAISTSGKVWFMQ